MKRKIYIYLIASAGLLLTACGGGKKNPGSIYMPDMTYSNAAETYSQGSVKNEDGIVMEARKPVSHTIPRGSLPEGADEAVLASYLSREIFTGTDENWAAESEKAGAILRNPIPPTAENLAEGKRMYTIHCSPCHGEKGNGQGQLVVLPDGGDGPFTAVPPDYKKRLPEINDGKIFYSVSFGKGMMGGFRNSLNVTERWQVIDYIKSLAGMTNDGAAKTTAVADSTVKK